MKLSLLRVLRGLGVQFPFLNAVRIGNTKLAMDAKGEHDMAGESSVTSFLCLDNCSWAALRESVFICGSPCES